MFEKNIEVVFVKEFTSPVLGNVYVGKTLKGSKKNLSKYIEMKVCEIVSDKEINKEVKKDGSNKPKRGKKSSKG